MKDVILIDDEIWALKDLTRMIERNPGWRVTGQFTDSNEALDAILASTPGSRRDRSEDGLAPLVSMPDQPTDGPAGQVRNDMIHRTLPNEYCKGGWEHENPFYGGI